MKSGLVVNAILQFTFKLKAAFSLNASVCHVMVISVLGTPAVDVNSNFLLEDDYIVN